MSINHHTTDPIEPELGTPQGSPLSPILSAFITGPILRLAETWDDSDLTLYVNDGLIFASGPTYAATAVKLTKAANCIFTWLRDVGFSIDADKCEAMFFHPRTTHDHLHGTPPANITVQLPDNSLVTIKPATSLRYLGVFFTPCLNWMTHVKTMSTWAQSLTKGLGVLGNSIRGFRLINWRKVFISIILPILTYGCQVWFCDISQITLIQTLQVAQNEACRKLASIFHTTPIAMTHSLLSIPPICSCLRSLLRSQGCHLASQPPKSLLCNLHLTQKMTLIPSHVPLAPLLPSIANPPPP